MKKKHMLVITHSTDDPARANGAMALLASLVCMEADVAVFLNFGGVLLAKSGVAETIEAENFTPVRELLPIVLEAAVPIYVCSASAGAYGVEEKDLIPGAILTNLPTLAFEMEERDTSTF